MKVALTFSQTCSVPTARTYGPPSINQCTYYGDVECYPALLRILWNFSSISSQDKVNAVFVTLIVETKPLFKAENIGSPFISCYIVSAPQTMMSVFPKHIIDARSKQVFRTKLHRVVCKSQGLLLAPIPSFILRVCGQITFHGLHIRCPQIMILSHLVSKPRIEFQGNNVETHYHH